MNINNNLDLLKNLMSELRLSKNNVGSSSMKTTVSSSEQNAVAANLEAEKKHKEELKKKKEKTLKVKSEDTDASVKEEKVIERDPLKLLKLF